ncbi:MAG: bifunctional UDP-4-keto-pentose/UDP-xylose synthase [Alphaproteobacteria bacterium]
MSLKILILGVNGFIGSALLEKILHEKNWIVYGIDLSEDKIKEFIGRPRFYFFKKDIIKNKDAILSYIKESDVVLPLAAIATPSVYVSDPLRVFELDFEANLHIIRQCSLYKKRVIFPSTSEVYGMCQDKEFDEEISDLVLGPIHKQRWIYSCSKQLLDRVIFAYGIHENLDYTIFRPFNWIGPKLDRLSKNKNETVRSVTQFLSDIIYRNEITLIDGGEQRRCFTDVDDGILALMKIIENKDNQASNRIFNIGNPHNNYSIKELAMSLIKKIKEHPNYKGKDILIKNVSSTSHYGKHYQDVTHRVPSIKKAKNYLNWEPKIDLDTSIQKILNHHLKNNEICRT